MMRSTPALNDILGTKVSTTLTLGHDKVLLRVRSSNFSAKHLALSEKHKKTVHNQRFPLPGG